jgi:glyoxylate reductase
MSRVLVTRHLPGPALERLGASHDVDVWAGDLPPDPATLRRLIGPAEGLLCLLTEQVDAELLDAAPASRSSPTTRWARTTWTSRPAAARGIPVGVTPGVLTDATADLAFGLLLAAARRLVAGFDDVRAGRWRTWEPEGWLGHDVHGATLVLVGAGRIGEAVARRARGFDMEVVMVGRGDDLHAALRRADFVSLHVPLSPQTRHLIDADALAQLKPTAVLVNTARGGVVDQDALAAALHDGRLAGSRPGRHRSRAPARRPPAAAGAEPPRGPPHRLGHPRHPGADDGDGRRQPPRRPGRAAPPPPGRLASRRCASPSWTSGRTRPACSSRTWPPAGR